MQPPPPRAVPAPREPPRRPARVELVPGTRYGLAIFAAPPTTSGPAVGGLVTGVAALLVSLLVACLGLSDLAASTSGGAGGRGALVGGAFAVLTGFLGAAGIGLGLVGLRQRRRTVPAVDGEIRGRGLAIAGIACGGTGIAIAACSLGAAVAAALS